MPVSYKSVKLDDIVYSWDSDSREIKKQLPNKELVIVGLEPKSENVEEAVIRIHYSNN